MIQPQFSNRKIIRAQKPSWAGMTIVGLTTLFIISPGGCRRHEQLQDVSQYPSTIEGLAIRSDQLDPFVESQNRGHQVYEHYCQICHGLEAQGDGFNAAMLDPPPRNFSDEAFWKQTDDTHLQKVISQGGEAGGKSVLMPAWGRTLDEQQIRDVVAFLRTVPDLAKQAEQAGEAEITGEEEGAVAAD